MRGLAFALVGIFAALTAGQLPASAQQVADYVPPAVRAHDFDLSIASIMRAEENVGQAPTQVRWTDDSRWIYFQWQPGGLEWNAGRSLYRVPAEGGEPERIDEVEAARLAPLVAGGDLSLDRTRRVTSVDGDLYLIDRATLDVRRLTHTEDAEGDPLFSEDGASVLFQRGGELFRLGIENGELTQLTRIESGPADEDEEAEGQRGFLERQQLELFEHIRRGERDEARADSIQELVEAGEPAPVHLESDEEVDELVPSRDGARVLVRTETPPEDELETMVPDWVTEDGYTTPLEVRTKVGDAQDASRAGVLETATGEMTWFDLTPEPAEVSHMGWNDAGTKAFLFMVSLDDKDRWLFGYDAETGETTLLDHLHDDAWVAGPCFSSCVGFVPDSDRVWFVSEETGYAHLYAVNADGSDKRALTSGEWEVLDVEIPEDRSRFLLRTNEGSPFNEHLYRMDFDGRGREALTEGEGRYVGSLSPDGERMAVLHDVANRPPELFVADADEVADMARITTSPTGDWLAFPWIRPEIVRFEAEDGTMVPARIYRPEDLGAESNGAAVIFVHGAGYLHNVHNYWSSYYREYQFHHFLAAAGYTVLDIDYRGSAGYGAEWRTAIYRWMGGKDLSDQVDGARYLVEQEGIDPARIGLYGGSYGGFITLMTLFTADDTFKAGAALRSVTDWAHYNHGYTSRILNLPQDDEEAYERSSPIYFAENFRPDQHLLILHGMVDTNVHFSDVVRLAQRLIELGKENWEFAVYPVENHGFVEPSSWTDEYRRIFELFERTLREPGCTEGGGFCTVRGAAAAP
ncbi:MAG: prolyl oligopeptidase family serine peptidase [Gemmatimonadota bacterium]